MITNTGKSIIAKYLTGQAPAYASYMAIGTGPKPLSTLAFSITQKALATGTVTLTTSVTHDISVGDYLTISGVGSGFDGVYQTISGTTGTTIKYTISDTTTSVSTTSVTPNGTATRNYSTKTSLDFEVARFPIITPRGYVTENNISKIVLTGQVPTESRYEITEVGIFSAASNPSANNNDSKLLYSFETSENWQYYDGTNLNTITPVTTLLDDGTNLTNTSLVFAAGADNTTFSNPLRLNRQERPRFGINTILLAANLDTLIAGTGYVAGTGPVAIGTSTKYLQILNSSNLDLSAYSSNDEIRVAFSIISKPNVDSGQPVGNIRMLIRFIDSAGLTSDMSVDIVPSISTRYQVVSKKISSFATTSGFNWAAISKTQIYSSIYSNVGNTTLYTSYEYYVALDAIRIENVSTTNSLYGLTGYSPVVNTEIYNATSYPRAIVKEANTQNYAEFRFIMDVT